MLTLICGVNVTTEINVFLPSIDASINADVWCDRPLNTAVRYVSLTVNSNSFSLFTFNVQGFFVNTSLNLLKHSNFCTSYPKVLASGLLLAKHQYITLVSFNPALLYPPSRALGGRKVEIFLCIKILYGIAFCGKDNRWIWMIISIFVEIIFDFENMIFAGRMNAWNWNCLYFLSRGYLFPSNTENWPKCTDHSALNNIVIGPSCISLKSTR